MARNVASPGHALARTTRAVEPATSGEARARRISASDGLQNVVAGLATERDKTSYNFYGFPRFLARIELDNMWRGSWLSKRIINTKATDMTREWREFKFEDGDDNERHDELIAAEKAFQIKPKVTDALRWGDLYGGCLVILGIRNDDLSTPLNVESIKKGDFKYLHVVDRWRCSPGLLNTDLRSPNFGMPDSYIVAESSVQVHHSRVLRFNGQRLPYFPWTSNSYWDDSELQHILNSLSNCDATSAQIATMMFEANVDVVSGSNVSDILTTEGGEAALTKRWALAMLMKSVNRTLLLDGDEKYDKKSNSFANLDKVWEKFQVDCCGAAEMPMTILWGQSAAGFSNGDEDTRAYYDMISSRQENKLRPQLEYLDEILVRSTLGDMPDDYTFEFKPLWQTSDSEQADIEFKNAQRDNLYVQMGAVNEGLVASELKARGTYRTMSQDDVDLAVELAEQPPPVVVPGAILPKPGRMAVQPTAAKPATATGNQKSGVGQGKDTPKPKKGQPAGNKRGR